VFLRAFKKHCGASPGKIEIEALPGLSPSQSDEAEFGWTTFDVECCAPVQALKLDTEVMR
jgi:hypothetical protein